MRYIEDEDGPKLLCKICDEYLPFEEYYPCKACRHGKMTTCKTCYNDKRKENLGEVVSDRDTVNQWLSRLGYEIGGEKTIHEQFLEKMAKKREGMPQQEPVVKKKIKDMTKEEYNQYHKELKIKRLKKNKK